MKTVTLSRDCNLAVDGRTVKSHKKGETVRVSDPVAAGLLAAGMVSTGRAKKEKAKPENKAMPPPENKEA